jgi:polar amino acid transport system substrate-binding protein
MQWQMTDHVRVRTLCLLVLLFMPTLVEADTSEIREPMKLVTGPHYAPFAADYLPSKGLGPYLVSRIFKASGRNATIDVRPWNRAYRESLNGKYDAILPYIETPERDEEYLFSVPVFKADSYAYVMADSKIDANSLAGLKGRKYCNPLGFADGIALQEMQSKGEITRLSAANLESCFKMLAIGRVDFIKINHYVAKYVMRQMDLSADDIRKLPFLVERISLHVMVPKTRRNAQALVSEFDRAFSEMNQSGRIQEWTQDYLEALDSVAELPAPAIL